MRKKWLIILIFILAFIIILLPTSFITAEPGNLIINGDFSDGSSNWGIHGPVNISGGVALVGPDFSQAFIDQGINTSRKDLKLSFDVNPITYGSGDLSVGFNIYNGPNVGYTRYDYNSFPIGEWTRNISFNIADCFYDGNGVDLPDFTYILIFLSSSNNATVYFDNVKLTYPESEGSEEPAWVRTMPMTCWQVWINEDNNFQFIFWYPYKDKNWVRIYDMEDNMVFETDLPWHDPNLIVDLPDGYYMVRTYHGEEMLQEFLIGKPGPEM
jgi:hypothetical protein